MLILKFPGHEICEPCTVQIWFYGTTRVGGQTCELNQHFIGGDNKMLIKYPTFKPEVEHRDDHAEDIEFIREWVRLRKYKSQCELLIKLEAKKG
mmetsp:Transcript_13626/g.18866  ORF Transcript_13626/g.18866 Transcript_13626/m.18866 type:complete len:94 (-) Transcript_13626:143-424(-)